MELWHLWIIIGIVFFIVEIFTPGFIVATFGGGCLLAAIPAYFQLQFLWQLLVFSLGTLIFFLTVRPLYLKYIFPPEEQTPTNVDALIGQKALVIEEIDALNNKGRVKVGGEDWKAISEKSPKIAEGELVKVVAIDGVKLIVEPYSKEEKS